MRPWIVVLLVGCGHPAKAPDKPTKPVVTAKTPATKPPPDAKPGDPVLPDIGCLTTSCAYHTGGNVYLTCLAGGAGVCFHFGAACTPPDACMFDATDKTYKTCKTPVEGTCTAWAAACNPASKCMVDPASGIYKHCDAPSGGKCPAFGAVCAP